MEPCRDGGNDARRRFAVVKTVAEAPDSLRPHFVRKPRQPVERVVAVIRRQRLARRGIEARLLEMEIGDDQRPVSRSEEHTSELQSLMRISYAVFCLKKKNIH